MMAPKFLIMNVLRIITPEEIGEITTKHNGGKFLSLTELIDERMEKNIIRDFNDPDHEAKILPFSKNKAEAEPTAATEEPDIDKAEGELRPLTAEFSLEHVAASSTDVEEEFEQKDHDTSENMSSFILIEKERFKRSQQTLKKKEIMDLYQKTAKVEVEQIKHTNQNLTSGSNDGVLVNKKQY